MKPPLKAFLPAFALTALPAAAVAHAGVHAAGGFMHGFMHPLGGFDHIFAMVAVGMIAAYLGGRALWLAPASFVAMMAAGGMLGLGRVEVPFVEIGIAASVIVLGLAVALRWGMPTFLAMALVGFFAIFHGHAHGTAMPAAATSLGYAQGFMLTTALLHLAGIGLGLGIGGIGARTSRVTLQASGGIMALAGVGILTGYL